MKRLTSALLVFMLTALTVLAQKTPGKSVFGVNTGVSIPLDEFAVKEFTYDAGFSSPGPNLKVEYLYYGKIIGFSSSLSYASLFFNEKKYQAEYDRAMGNYGTNDVSAGNYQIIKALVGFTLKIPEFHHTEVMLLFHLGYAKAVHPNLLVTNSEFGVINSLARNSGNGPVANMGFNINYWLNERYGVSLNGSVNGMSSGFGDNTAPDGYFILPMNHASINIGFVMNLKSASL